MILSRATHTLTHSFLAIGFLSNIYPASAQSLPGPSPVQPTVVDETGVDIQSRTVMLPLASMEVGSGDFKLDYDLKMYNSRASYLLDSHIGGMSYENCGVSAGTADDSECFTLSGSTYLPYHSNGAALVDQGSGIYLYTSRRGVKYTIDTSIWGLGGPLTTAGLITKVERPDGLTLTYTYKIVPQTGYSAVRIQTISSNVGYSLKYEYSSDVVNAGGVMIGGWSQLSRVTAFNAAKEYCDVQAAHCTFANAWPSMQFSFASLGQYVGYSVNITHPNGSTSALTLDPIGRVVGYRPPSATVNQFTYTHCRALNQAPAQYQSNYGDPCSITNSSGTTIVNDGVKWSTKEGRQWNYNPQLSIGGCGCYYYNTSRDPDNRSISISTFTNSAQAQITSATSKNGTSYSYNGQRQFITGMTIPQQAAYSYQYDGRGNVTEARRPAAAGSGQSDLVTTATYDAICSNMATCNQPNTVTDPKGNIYTYTYHSSSGKLATDTRPLVNGVAKQTRYTYAQRYPWTLSASGVATQSVQPIWVLTRTSECETSAWTGTACAAGVSDELVTDFDYGPTTGANNLLLRGATVTAGQLAQRTCYQYDAAGRQIAQTTPRASLATCN